MTQPRHSRLSRRQVFAGAGTAGALAAAATVVPLAGPQTATTASDAKPTSDKGGGYQVTQHVLRYYETTKV